MASTFELVAVGQGDGSESLWTHGRAQERSIGGRSLAEKGRQGSLVPGLAEEWGYPKQ
jgi:hypothetical protein